MNSFEEAIRHVSQTLGTCARYHTEFDGERLKSLWQYIEQADVAAHSLGLRFPEVDVLEGQANCKVWGWIQVPWRHYQTASALTSASGTYLVEKSTGLRAGAEFYGMQFLQTDGWNRAMRILIVQARDYEPSEPLTFAKWKQRFGWPPQTWRNRRNRYPEGVFFDIPGTHACRIRMDYVKQWDEEAKVRNI